MIEMVACAWWIYVAVMAFVLLISAVGMFRLFICLYPFESKHEIVYIVACGVIMLIAVAFLVYGVKRIITPETEAVVETEMKTEIAAEAAVETEVNTEAETAAEPDSKNTVEVGTLIVLSIVIVWMIYFGFLLSEYDFDAVSLALQITGIITFIGFAFAMSRVDLDDYFYLFICICIYFVLSVIAGYFLLGKWNGNGMAAIFVVLAVLSVFLVLGTYKDLRKEIPMRESTRMVVYVNEYNTRSK